MRTTAVQLLQHQKIISWNGWQMHYVAEGINDEDVAEKGFFGCGRSYLEEGLLKVEENRGSTTKIIQNDGKFISTPRK